MLISEQGYIYLKSGEISYKDVSLLNNSNHIVIVKCDDCSLEFETIWSNRKSRLKKGRIDLCLSCARSGFRNSQYGKERRHLCDYARKFLTKNPMLGKFHSDETKQKMSLIKINQINTGKFNINSNNRGRKFWHFSIKNNKKYHADSALELMRMIQLDNDCEVKKWTKHHCLRIPYIYKGVQKNTSPDFLIELQNGAKIIEEVKGRLTEVEIVKKIAIENYCLLNNFQFSFKTQKDLNKKGEYRAFLRKINKI
jgi:hypothetical protein